MVDEFPQMFRVRQRLDATPPIDVAASVVDGFSSIRGQLKPGMRIGVGVGSRGISNLAKAVAAVIGELKKAGTEPFIIPAMGSHGGATPEGQVAVLAGYGVTESSMGVPILATMDVEPIGQAEDGREVLWSREAASSDGIIVINRVKPHTSFSKPVGSGLTKMLVVGLGKHAGASAYHAAALRLGYGEALMGLAGVVLARAPILGGVALVENGLHETARVEVLAADAITRREPELCAEAAAMMPSLPFHEIDLLIVDQIGKNISGTGMDTNTIGRRGSGYRLVPDAAAAKPFIWRIFVRGLTPESCGNAIGIGLAEATTRRLLADIDTDALHTNSITSRSVLSAKLPMAFETDAAAVHAMLASLPDADPAKARVVRIRDTLSLGLLEVSAALGVEVEAHPALEPLGQAEPMQFDDSGNLAVLAQ
ncbi:MAG: lactate racemase domain-containing protein [Verrucomicrobiota bacterium]|nr:lactate racemase domain-containing protein [Verrucomicrobiota bacterium]